MSIEPIHLLFDTFADLHVLSNCAKRSQTPFGLAGKLVETLLEAALGHDPSPAKFRPSFFDLVDAVSEIQLAVPSREFLPRVASVITSALPISSFFRWHADSWEAMAHHTTWKSASRFDGLLLLFHENGTVSLLQHDGHEDSVYAELKDGKSGAPAPTKFSFLDSCLIALIRHVGRRSRYSNIDSTGLTELWTRAEELRKEMKTSGAYLLMESMQQIDAELVNAVLGAAKPADVLQELSRLLDLLPPSVAKGSESFVALERYRKDPGLVNSIGLVSYPANLDGKSRHKLDLGYHDDLDSLDDGATPWQGFTTGTAEGTGTTDCCDFFGGPPVITAWRGLTPEYERLKDQSLTSVGVEARHFASKEDPFALPALHLIGSSTVIRADSSYARSAVGDGVQLQMRLVQPHQDPEADE